MINIISTLLVLSLSHLARAWRARESFQHFFPDVEVELSKAVTNHCSNVLHKYQNEHITLYGVYCVKTYSCIMNHVTEYTKANMASAAVLLGLTPTILTALGSSSAELSLLSSHRPALALLLLLGSPAINPIRTFDYHNQVEESQDKKWRWYVPKNSQKSERSRIGDNIRVIFQLLFAIGSIANLADLCRTIALNTISVMSCDFSDVVVELWIGLAIPAHLGGIITFYKRYQKAHPGAWLRYEFNLCVTHTSHGSRLENEENRAFIVWTFLTSVYTIVHITAGTLIFSSLSFVGMLTISLQQMSQDYILLKEPSDADICRKY
jgi:hypothetical protein